MTNDLIKYIASKRCRYTDGIHYLSQPGALENQEDRYLTIRKKEGRFYPDAIVQSLPCIDPSHPLFKEWRIRGDSMGRACSYVEALGRPLQILDVGCGNGWMSNHLACIPGVEVFGLDMNRPELEQGARVFKDNASLTLLYGDLFEEIFEADTFDVAVLAGSIQYFPDLKALLDRILQLLKKGGEAHLIDSPLYAEGAVSQARERTRLHFEGLGCPEMAAHYHHHLYATLEPFRPRYLHDPKNFFNRLARRLWCRDRSPFPWIKLQKLA